MKRILSIIIVMAMVLSTLVTLVSAAKEVNGEWAPDNSKFDAISRKGVVARFAIGADIHFDYYASAEKNKYVYSALEQIGGVDAYLIAGDLTHYGQNANYTNLMKSVNAYTKKNDVNPDATGNSVGMTILSMGNHEYWPVVYPGNSISIPCEEQFKKFTKQETDALYWVSGIPVIKLSPDDMIPDRNPEGTVGSSYDLSYDFLKSAYAEIDAKGYKGIIIMMAHHRTPTDGKQDKAWSQENLDLIKAHPNTIIFTGHSHTWFHRMDQYILQDAGFTHVRAGSLANGYGGIGNGYINAKNGSSSDIALHYSENDTCSFVLVDILEDGRARLRQIDMSKGVILYENEEFYVTPGVLTDYLTTDNDNFDLSYGNGSKAPSFPDDMSISWEDLGNHNSVKIIFDPATAASSLAKDFVAEYRIRLVDADGNYVMNGSRNYFRVANYRPDSKANEPWSVAINGLSWDTDYTIEIKAYSAYGKATPWVKSDVKVNVGHGTPTYPVVPVIDFDYSYGSIQDGAGHKLLSEPKIVKEAEINGQKAVNFLGLGGIAYSYEFTEEDYLSVRNDCTIEAYFSATNVTMAQCILGGWGSAPFSLKINDGNLYLRAKFVSTEGSTTEEEELLGYKIEKDTWYHAIATYDGNNIKLYVNGELVAEESGYTGGLATVSYEAEADEENPDAVAEKITRSFAVGAGRYDNEGEHYLMQTCSINKAAFYAGTMTAEDVKNAYKVAATALPFTDVQDGWYIDSVEYAYATGLMNGSSATTFSPSVKTNRAMIVQMLYNLEGKPAVDKSNNPFTDVPDTWYTDAVLWAYQSGVTTGTSATTFSPDALVTREQVAVFLYRYMRDYKKADMGEGADLSAFPTLTLSASTPTLLPLWRGLTQTVSSAVRRTDQT
ncbi:MAG: S-layer homology domain-containing protein [Clostridia bacterium]|nr:S-layer homology domain-containing protein [Clostridia bacterium]